MWEAREKQMVKLEAVEIIEFLTVLNLATGMSTDALSKLFEPVFDVHYNQATIVHVSVPVSVGKPLVCMHLCTSRDTPDTQSHIHAHCSLFSFVWSAPSCELFCSGVQEPDFCWVQRPRPPPFSAFNINININVWVIITVRNIFFPHCYNYG